MEEILCYCFLFFIPLFLFFLWIVGESGYPGKVSETDATAKRPSGFVAQDEQFWRLFFLVIPASRQFRDWEPFLYCIH